MADYQTTDYILAIVASLLVPITVPKYIKTKPAKKADAEYIVINALPINADVMQKCYVNVNYHVRDIKDTGGPSGIEDSVKIEAGSRAVLNILKKVSTTTYLIDFESQETIREEGLGEHYSNLRFSFKFINR
jgi:hypothetical protein